MMIPMHIANTHSRPRCRYFCIEYPAVEIFLASDWLMMPPPLTQCQLELARHWFQFNDSSTYYLNKLSTQDIADDIQRSVQTVRRLKKLWDKTRDVEKFINDPGRERSVSDHVEQVLRHQ